MAADMEQQFSDSWQDQSGVLSRLRLLSGALVSLTVSAFAERRHSSLDGSIMRVARRGGNEPRGGGIVFGLLQDTRYTLRLLRRQPGFSLFVMLTMAVGIGANVAVFSVVDGVLLKPLPFARAIGWSPSGDASIPRAASTSRSFLCPIPSSSTTGRKPMPSQDVAAWSRQSVTVGGPGAEPERVVAASVSANLFSLLRVSPSAGRTFTDEEDRPKAPPVAVLSAGYWRSHFAGDPSVVGRTVLMNGVPTTIVGIMPEGFAFPGTTTRIWIPLGIDPANPGQPSGAQYSSDRQAGARCVSIETARAELRTIMSAWKARYPAIHTGHYLFMRPMLEEVSGSIRPALVALLGATGFVLLIVCANVANLMLARGEARTREMAIRGALGAQRGRLLRLTLLESGILAIVGGGLGLALAGIGVRFLLTLDSAGIPRASEVGLDGAHGRVHAARHAGLGDAVGTRAGRARRLSRAARHASRHEPDGDRGRWSPAHSAIARHARSRLVCGARPWRGADAPQLRAAVVRRPGIPAVERA